jgi:hypothetical protein
MDVQRKCHNTKPLWLLSCSSPLKMQLCEVRHEAKGKVVLMLHQLVTMHEAKGKVVIMLHQLVTMPEAKGKVVLMLHQLAKGKVVITLHQLVTMPETKGKVVITLHQLVTMPEAKGKVVIMLQQLVTMPESGGAVPPFLTSAVDKGGRSTSCPLSLYPWWRSSLVPSLDRCWMGLTLRLVVVEKEKNLPLLGIKSMPYSSQPIAIPTKLS